MTTFHEQWRLLLDRSRLFADRGYALAEDRGPEAMESGLRRFSKGNVSVLVHADRGDWSVEAATTEDGTSMLALEVWRVCLGVAAPPAAPGRDTLGQQLDWTFAALPAIEGACSADRIEMTRECLAAALRAIQLSGFITLPAPAAPHGIRER